MLIDPAMQALTYLLSHPMFPLQSARNAMRRELTVPLALLRWGIDRRKRGKGPEKIEIFPADPALGVALTVDLFGTKLEVSSEITVESVELGENALNLALRVANLRLGAPEGSPAAMMVKSLDLSRPAALMNMMPQKHAALVDAKDDRFVIDLLKIKALARNPYLKRVLAALSFVRVAGARVDGDNLALELDVSPLAAPSALLRAWGHVPAEIR
jgi:hypothetical protein